MKGPYRSLKDRRFMLRRAMRVQPVVRIPAVYGESIALNASAMNAAHSLSRVSPTTSFNEAIRFLSRVSGERIAEPSWDELALIEKFSESPTARLQESIRHVISTMKAKDSFEVRVAGVGVVILHVIIPQRIVRKGREVKHG